MKPFFNNSRIYVLIILSFFLSGIIYAQENKMLSPVIIDTDCAMDDFRALSMFFSVNELNIKAITVVDGILSPNQGMKKASQLLSFYNKKNIPVAKGKIVNTTIPVHRKYSFKIQWGNISDTNSLLKKDDASSVLISSILQSEVPVTVICLGPLSNLAEALTINPAIKANIKNVIWYNKNYKKHTGFNFTRDSASANYVCNSGVEIKILSKLNNEYAYFDTTLFQSIKNINSKSAQNVVQGFQIPYFLNKINEGNLPLFDDLVPVYYIYPELFDFEYDLQNPKIQYVVNYDMNAVKEKMVKILSGSYIINKQIVFESFPLLPGFYRSDVKERMEKTISDYGELEWEFCVLTNEIHGHLGIYSILGAKMGLKAMEVLNANRDEIVVQTYAGNQPPLGCLNDGLQVSTGATFGHGTIASVKDTLLMPAAIFMTKKDTIRIKLKDEYIHRIQEDINNGIVQYGMLTSGYWKLIRSLGIKYWAEWDRNKIFEISEE
ncbi:MAG: hypothetical protein GXO79_14780 [Chlorobi bacterium]|nr:hypothetical protein [Chlorobiota bacterium]